MIAKMMVNRSCLLEKILADTSVVVVKLKRHIEGCIDKDFPINSIYINLNRIYRGGSRNFPNFLYYFV